MFHMLSLQLSMNQGNNKTFETLNPIIAKFFLITKLQDVAGFFFCRTPAHTHGKHDEKPVSPEAAGELG